MLLPIVQGKFLILTIIQREEINLQNKFFNSHMVVPNLIIPSHFMSFIIDLKRIGTLFVTLTNKSIFHIFTFDEESLKSINEDI